MPSISIKAIVVGAVIDIGGSMLVGGLFVFVYMLVLASQNVPQEELQRRVLADQDYYIVSLVLGLAFMAVGAFVAARMARAREMAHALWVGLVAVAVSVPLVAAGDTSAYPSWYMPVSFALTIPAALVGGYIARRRTIASAGRAA
jgi:uncharacterized membrane protein